MLSESRGTVRVVTTGTRRPQGLQLTAVLLLAAAAPLWAILITQLWVPVPEKSLYLVVPLAMAITIVAAIFWVGGHNSRRASDINETLAENNNLALDTLWNLTRHASGRMTDPLRRVK